MVCKSVGFLRRNPLILAFFIVGMGTLFHAQAADKPAAAPQVEDAAKPAAAAKDAAKPAAAAKDAAKPAATQADVEAQPKMAEEKPCGSITEESINKLQDERTPAGEKLSLMQSLADLSKEDAQKCLQKVTEKEMIALTVIELARHTDKALAEKAKAVEANFDIKSYVDTAFTDPAGKIDIITLLLRIEKERVGAILSGLSSEKKQAIEKKLSHYVPTVLIPTGSSEGDRYYVKISWNGEDSEQVDCLAKLFNEEILSSKSIEAEKSKMQELKGHRWIYWYDKGWAMHIFEQALRCKATPAFVRN